MKLNVVPKLFTFDLVSYCVEIVRHCFNETPPPLFGYTNLIFIREILWRCTATEICECVHVCSFFLYRFSCNMVFNQQCWQEAQITSNVDTDSIVSVDLNSFTWTLSVFFRLKSIDFVEDCSEESLARLAARHSLHTEFEWLRMCKIKCVWALKFRN